MCEFLIFTRDNTNPDPEKNRRGCYKRGMVVVVFEDGHTWGREESKQMWIAEGNTAASWPGQGRWVILKIPGVPAAKARALAAVQDVDDAGQPYFGDIPLANPVQSNFRRRGWQVRLDDVQANVRNKLVADGEYTTTVAAIRSYLSRIRDGAQFTGLD